MHYAADDYEKRAEECVVLAKMARDEMISAELLRLRQGYLKIAQRLRELELTVSNPRS